MAKSAQAFRTIREVADWLGVAAHVLRFWESKFPQIKPVKRAGGRRYYRPGDMELVGGIKVLLHDQGMTIKGVQNLIQAEGIDHIAAMSPPLGSEDAAEDADDAAEWDRDLAREARAALVEDAEVVGAPEMLQEMAPPAPSREAVAEAAAEPAAGLFTTPETGPPEDAATEGSAPETGGGTPAPALDMPFAGDGPRDGPEDTDTAAAKATADLPKGPGDDGDLGPSDLLAALVAQMPALAAAPARHAGAVARLRALADRMAAKA